MVFTDALIQSYCWKVSCISECLWSSSTFVYRLLNVCTDLTPVDQVLFLCSEFRFFAHLWSTCWWEFNSFSALSCVISPDVSLPASNCQNEKSTVCFWICELSLSHKDFHSSVWRTETFSFPDSCVDVVLQFRDMDEPAVSHYELQGSTVVIQMDSVSLRNTTVNLLLHQ